MLKFFWVKLWPVPENWHFPKTLRFRENFARHGILLVKSSQKYGLPTVAIA